MPERVNGGLVLAAIGAVALLVSLFLNWYEPGRSAWTVFELDDLVLAALALLVLGVALADIMVRPDAGKYVPEGSVLYAGIGALIIVVATLIQPPPAALHASPQVGAWVGLVAAVLITAGGVLLRARVSIVIALRSRDERRRPDVRVTGRPEGTMPEPPGAGPDPTPEDTETQTFQGESR